MLGVSRPVKLKTVGSELEKRKLENLKRRDHLEELGVDGKTILERIIDE
jgi:hypothetical protein